MQDRRISNQVSFVKYKDDNASMRNRSYKDYLTNFNYISFYKFHDEAIYF
jgi:hypothetical protein